MCVCACVCVCVRVCVSSLAVSDSLVPQGHGSSVLGILQARILEWVAMLSSRGSSQPRYWTQGSRIAGRFFYHLSYQGTQWDAMVHPSCPGSPPEGRADSAHTWPLNTHRNFTKRVFWVQGMTAQQPQNWGDKTFKIQVQVLPIRPLSFWFCGSFLNFRWAWLLGWVVGAWLHGL